MNLFILFLLCHIVSSAKYDGHVDQTLSFGYPNISNFMITGTLQDITAFYYDDSMTTPKVTHDFMREVIKNKEKEWESSVQEIINAQHAIKAKINNFKHLSNKTDGGFIVQQRIGCEWDDETDEAEAYIRFGINGEDFIAFDMKTETWIASTERAETIKLVWDKDKVRNEFIKNSILEYCPRMMKIDLNFGKTYINRKALPSVSLLQKTPSSPVSCHATGFYPNKVMMFWSKDGEEIHEGVNHGNILPNHDESFQMSVDLDVSSIPSEEWTKYDCVFQLSGVKDDIVTRLDKAKIWTNWVPPPEFPVGPVVGVGVVLLLAVIGVYLWRKTKGERGIQQENILHLVESQLV